jgi:hypothetical protein
MLFLVGEGAIEWPMFYPKWGDRYLKLDLAHALPQLAQEKTESPKD